ncbi:MAG: ABC transporter permease [Caldilineales bacterium]|nr:ABC transporter permease [Caldilineales bacterium]MDW8317491.1 ABC transporter permease [Anaerolineae bacterium]
MSKTLAIMAAEIRTTLRRKSFVIFAFVVPIVLGLVAAGVGWANRNALSNAMAEAQAAALAGPSSRPTGLVDPGHLIRTMPPGLAGARLVQYEDEAAASKALAAGEITGYYVISADYVQSGQVTYVTDDYDLASDRLDRSLLEHLLLVNLLGGDAGLAAVVQQPLQLQITSLAPPVEASWITEMLPFFMVLILYLALVLPGSILINALVDEKKNRVIEVLMTSVSPTQMVTGKVMALGLLGLAMTALWLGVLWAVARFGGQALGIPAGFALPTALLGWALIFFLGGYAIYGAQFAGIGALAPDINQTKSVTWIVMLPIIVAYMFMAVSSGNPTGPLAIFLSLFPLTSSVVMIGRMAAVEVPLWQAALAAVLQFVTAYFIIRLTARLFRAQYLLTGQPLTARSFYRALLARG